MSTKHSCEALKNALHSVLNPRAITDEQAAAILDLVMPSLISDLVRVGTSPVERDALDRAVFEAAVTQDALAGGFNEPSLRQIEIDGCWVYETPSLVSAWWGWKTHAALARQQAKSGPVANDAAVAAIHYALKHHMDDPIQFLHCWNEGNFDALRREWEGVPEEVFIGADPLHPATCRDDNPVRSYTH